MADTSVRDQFRLSGAWNFRDVGGARTADGRRVRSGVLLRSSELTRLDDDGRAEMSRLGVRHVFDLRGDSEIERSGRDLVPEGVVVHNLPYHNHRGERAPHEAGASVDPEAQLRYMMRAYTSFPTLEGAHAAIRSVVTSLSNDEGPVLVHCAAGKDRAGWTVATVLRAVGVAESDVLADFLTSNTAIEPLRAHLEQVWAPREGGTPVELTDAVLGVTEAYYRHGIEVATEEHGSFDGYLRAIGVTADDLEKLKRTLLVDEN
ncbi:tyrosine-protein phosphatase [Rhodococcoides kyotonense]|uniref:Phosphotyrosine protein phosphatase n=1 Tax=Rhodococcoides kyotonense TaxID=398843 RepID=A0A177Y7I0_9NOCA|nr:tyrosine-protein phosphatase [Rhodococcus kyotonensis]OAK51108.1 phosphotyrosine protein phosphatase [Rhodococcus kyotonensis]